MKVELFTCEICGQIRLVGKGSAQPRQAICGGEGLERANGGQTHDWQRMQNLGTLDVEQLLAAFPGRT